MFGGEPLGVLVRVPVRAWRVRPNRPVRLKVADVLRAGGYPVVKVAAEVAAVVDDDPAVRTDL